MEVSNMKKVWLILLVISASLGLRAGSCEAEAWMCGGYVAAVVPEGGSCVTLSSPNLASVRVYDASGNLVIFRSTTCRLSCI